MPVQSLAWHCCARGVLFGGGQGGGEEARDDETKNIHYETESQYHTLQYSKGLKNCVMMNFLVEWTVKKYNEMCCLSSGGRATTETQFHFLQHTTTQRIE